MLPAEDLNGKSARLTFGSLIFMSSVLVKLQRKGQMVIPRSLREEAGVSEGTLMKVAVLEGGQLLITPQVTIARSVVHGRKDRKQAFRDLAQVVAELRQESKEKGLDTMSKAEINRAVAAARRDLKKSSKPPVK
jgi:AbrB family looped-hinge helix DNA binding protein